jgi:hypothetical protein
MTGPPIVYVAHTAEQADAVLWHVGRLRNAGVAQITVTAASDASSSVVVCGRAGRDAQQVVISANGDTAGR